MNFDYNRLYLTSEGRIGRQDFWMGLVGLLVVGIVVSLIIGALFGMVSFSARLLNFILQLVFAYPAFCLMAKRFQDRDRPGSFAWIIIGLGLLVSLLGLIGLTGDPANPNWLGWVLNLADAAIAIWFLIELGFLRGTQGANQYGGDPLAAT
jgi:uncharacterized membrane protein YhaH (DUF805 family)